MAEAERKVVKKLDYVTYYDNGMIEVFGNQDGTPLIGAVLPAPDVNTTSEGERQKRHQEGLESLILHGYFILSQRRVRNKVFDRVGQQTTLSVKYRPCMNEDEIKVTYKKIQGILLDRTKKELASREQKMPRL